jgi:hypothetical protein
MEQKNLEQLIKAADALIEGSVNDLPKNLMNFKLFLEGVKIELEQKKVDDQKSLAKQVPGYFLDPDEPRKNYKAEGEALKEATDTAVDIEDDTPVEKPKRTRRTKKEMEAARAALEKAEAIEEKVDAALERIDIEGEKENIPQEIVEDIKEAVQDQKEAWEDVADEEQMAQNIQDFDDSSPERTSAEKVTDIIRNYPEKLNVSLMNTTEKKALVVDMKILKTLVGNENVTDIEEKLDVMNLELAVYERTVKFLKALPYLEVEFS